MFIAVMMSVFGIAYYVGRYMYDKRKNRSADRNLQSGFDAEHEARARVKRLYVDVDGSKDFRDLMIGNREFFLRVQRESTAILRSIPGLAHAKAVYPGNKVNSGGFLLAAFLHFIPSGKIYDWCVLAEGPRPFGMEIPDAELVMCWGRRELRSRGVPVTIYKGWDVHGIEVYDWNIPLGARKWIELPERL